MYLSNITKERFMSKVEKTDGCWNWIASSRGNGYGVFKYNGKLFSSHRISYMIHKGEIPKGMLVCHTCDNRNCVNPEHLFVGTYSDNMKDCYQKGRIHVSPNFPHKIGEPNKNRKLNKNIILEIRKLKTTGTTIRAIGIIYNIHHSTVLDICNMKIYKDII